MKKNCIAAFVIGMSYVAMTSVGAQTPEPFRIAVLNDQSSVYSDASGRGSVVSAQLAVQDFGGKVLGRPIELLFADHQNKADVGSAIVREWLDKKNVEAVFDLQTGGVALTVIPLIVKANKVAMISSAASSDMTGKNCTPNSVHWTFDTHAVAQVLPNGLLGQNLKSWYFVTTDYTFGHAQERDISAAVKARGGNVVGSSKVPLATLDFSSALLVAQNSGAQVVVLGGGGADAVNQLKQSAEYGIPKKQRIVSPVSMITEVEGAGLETAQGLYVTESFYWDMNEQTRAWSKRYIEKIGKPANMLQAGNYGAVMHYLKTVQALGTTNGVEVVKAMKKTPINDFMTTNGSIREDGRVMRNMYLFQVKSPAESKYKFDDYKLVATYPGDKVFRPLSESDCPMIKK